MSTQIIYAKSTNSGAPQVTNTWGSITNLLQKVLVEGYLVSTITATAVENDLLKITCANKHGLVNLQTINLLTSSETTSSIFTVVFKVFDDFSFFIKRNSVTSTDFYQGSVKIPPLGWEVLYNLDNKAVFKPTSTEGPNHPLFVSNKKPYEGYLDSSIKFANFGLAEEFLDNFEPRGLTEPTQWSTLTPQGTGTTMAFGFNRIFHNAHASWNWESNNYHMNTENGSCDWLIVGNDSYFYLHLKVGPSKDAYILFGAGNYDSFIEGFKHNSFVAGCLFNDVTTSSVNSLDYSGLFCNGAHVKTLSGVSDISVKKLTVHSYMNMTYSGGSEVLSNDSSYIHMFKAYLKDSSNQLAGSLKGLYWLANTVPFSNFRVYNQGNGLYLPVPVYYKGVGQVALKIGEFDES